MKFRKTKLTSVIGLSLDTHRITGVWLRQPNGRARMERYFETVLDEGLMQMEPEHIGKMLREKLDRQEIRETRCAISLPLNWILTAQVDLPDLQGEDLKSYLDLRAEQEFPFPPDDLSLALSIREQPGGTKAGTLVAVPKKYLVRLETLLAAAGLRAISVSPGMTRLKFPDAAAAPCMASLVFGGGRADLRIHCGGGEAVLRTLNEWEAGRLDDVEGHARALLREIRITQGQLPSEVREAVRAIYLAGIDLETPSLKEIMTHRLETLHLQVHEMESEFPEEMKTLENAVDVNGFATAAALDVLSDRAPVLEFLPRKETSLDIWMDRFSSRRNAWVGGGAAVAVVLVLLGLLIQTWRLSSLESRWEAMSESVNEAEAVQSNIRSFRAWFETSAPNLDVARSVTLAFPENGEVWAKSLEIKDLSNVTCTGFARGNGSLLDMLDELQKNRAVGDLQVRQMRGENPVQFAIHFQWKEGGVRE